MSGVALAKNIFVCVIVLCVLTVSIIACCGVFNIKHEPTQQPVEAASFSDEISCYTTYTLQTTSTSPSYTNGTKYGWTYNSSGYLQSDNYNVESSYATFSIIYTARAGDVITFEYQCASLFYPAMMRENVLKKGTRPIIITFFTALYQLSYSHHCFQEARLELATSGLRGYVIIICFAVRVF